MQYALGHIDRDEYLRKQGNAPQKGALGATSPPRPKSRRLVWVLVIGIILIVVIIAIAVIMIPTFGNNSTISVTVSPPEQLSQEGLSAVNSSEGNVIAFPENNTIWVGEGQSRVTVLSSPPGHDEEFVMLNQTNPTIHLARGATLVLVVANPDPGTYHNLAITTRGPPYGQMPMMQMMNAPGTMMLPPTSNGTYSAQQLQVTAQAPGQYWYICQYPGHANEKMYGSLIIS